MPAKKTDARDKAFNGAIGRHIEAEGIDKSDLIKRIGISRSTLWQWQKEPGKVSLGNLRVLAKETRMSDEDILQIVRAAK